MSVNERMICHAIIGRNPHKERIMTVDISARFIAPLLEFSSQELLFQLYQVGVQPYLHVHHTYTLKKLCSSQMSCSCTMSRCNDIYYSVCINSCFCEFITVLFVVAFFQPPGSKLVQHTQELGVRNISPLPVTAVVSCSYPFSIVKNNTALAQMVSPVCNS